MEITIEKATLRDIDRIVEIENSCFSIDRYSRGQFRYLIEKSQGAFYVARQDGIVVGFISLLSNVRTKRLRVYSIAVDNKYKDHGIGSALIERAKVYASENGLKVIGLEVRIDNTSAIALYEKKGFIKDKIKSAYYEDGSDAYAMSFVVK